MNVITPLEFKSVSGYAVYYFGADWCSPCKSAAPEIAKIVENYPDTYFLKIDLTDRNIKLPEIFSKIRSIPTIVVMQDGAIISQFSYNKQKFIEAISKSEIKLTSTEELVLMLNKTKPTHTIMDEPAIYALPFIDKIREIGIKIAKEDESKLYYIPRTENFVVIFNDTEIKHI